MHNRWFHDSALQTFNANAYLRLEVTFSYEQNNDEAKDSAKK